MTPLQQAATQPSTGERAELIARLQEAQVMMDYDPIEAHAAMGAAIDMLEADAQEICTLKDSTNFYKRRVELLQKWQSKMRDPERTIACDIIANGQTLPPENAGARYKVPVDAQQVAVPAGYALVPIEPTDAMLEAGRDTPCTADAHDDEDIKKDYCKVYRSMLKAAPPATPRRHTMKSNIEFLYEELRKATDGGSESMTHDDALKLISYWWDKCSQAQAVEPVSLNLAQCSQLIEMFGGDLDTEITLLHGEGHSGKGWYAYYDELPEEGAELLDPLFTHPAPPPAYDQQALELCDVCGWKAIMPGDPCFVCNLQKEAQQVAVPDGSTHSSLRPPRTAQEFHFGMLVLNWNRRQTDPPIDVGRELWVADEMLKLQAFNECPTQKVAASMTMEEIVTAAGAQHIDVYAASFMCGIRAAEAHHGITPQGDKT